MKISDIEFFGVSEDLWEKHHTNRKSSYYFNENYTVVYTLSIWQSSCHLASGVL